MVPRREMTMTLPRSCSHLPVHADVPMSIGYQGRGSTQRPPLKVALVALLVEVVESIKAIGIAFGKTSKRLKDLKGHDLAKICSQVMAVSS